MSHRKNPIPTPVRGHLGHLGTHISPSLQQYRIMTRHVVLN